MLVEREVEFRLVGLALFGADDHVGLIGSDIEVAIETRFVEWLTEALHGDRMI